MVVLMCAPQDAYQCTRHVSGVEKHDTILSCNKSDTNSHYHTETCTARLMHIGNQPKAHIRQGTLAGREALTPKNSAHDHHLVRIELPVHLPGTGVGRCIMSIKKELAHQSGQFFTVRQQRQHCAAQSWLHRRCSN